MAICLSAAGHQGKHGILMKHWVTYGASKFELESSLLSPVIAMLAKPHCFTLLSFGDGEHFFYVEILLSSTTWGKMDWLNHSKITISTETAMGSMNYVLDLWCRNWANTLKMLHPTSVIFSFSMRFQHFSLHLGDYKGNCWFFSLHWWELQIKLRVWPHLPDQHLPWGDEQGGEKGGLRAHT